jgi:hypothetical protein
MKHGNMSSEKICIILAFLGKSPYVQMLDCVQNGALYLCLCAFRMNPYHTYKWKQTKLYITKLKSIKKNSLSLLFRAQLHSFIMNKRDLMCITAKSWICSRQGRLSFYLASFWSRHPSTGPRRWKVTRPRPHPCILPFGFRAKNLLMGTVLKFECLEIQIPSDLSKSKLKKYSTIWKFSVQQ